MGERRICPVCQTESDVELIEKPDASVKICKNCGGAVSILYKDT